MQRVLARGAAALAPDLAGPSVVVSAGGTREELDPVRFLGNWSSGGRATRWRGTAAGRGAEVTLVAANTGLPTRRASGVIRVGSPAEMRVAMLAAAGATPTRS